MEAPIPNSREQTGFWDQHGPGKRFNHPLNVSWLDEHLPSTACVLDFGCGYGRLFETLREMGYAVIGADRSAGMVELARQRHPEIEVFHVDSSLPWSANSFDCVLLVALLTSIPRRDEQRSLVREIVRVLRPGGHLYVSDLPLQWDPRNIARYATGLARFGDYGVFATAEACVVRHHTLDHVVELLKDFTIIGAETFDVITMDGNSARAFRVLAQLSQTAEGG